MSVSLRENITAVIETCFSETKDEIQEVAINRILELIRNDKADRKAENSSEKPNNCDTCRWWEENTNFCYSKADSDDHACHYEPKDEPQTERSSECI